MKLELLYFEGCPNWEKTMEDINAVLQESHVAAEVELIKVTSHEEAEQLAFLGSPTIRIYGLDIEPDPPDSAYGLELRVYWVDETPLGGPPKEWIAAAVQAALE